MCPLYDFECPKHGIFERIQSSDKSVSSCPECGKDAPRRYPHIAFFRMHHTETLEYNDPARVYDRQRMMKDPALQRTLADYKEEQFYTKSPYNPSKLGGK